MLLTEGEVKTKISHHTLKNDSNRRYKGTTFGEARGGDLVERGESLAVKRRKNPALEFFPYRVEK
jgi:hypothetical protein